MLALIGMGLMYGPVRPVRKAIGNRAAITVSVASTVGPPTSSTARGISSDSVLSGWSCCCRWMFSTTTMASSTRMPMEKIRANSDTRLSVKPQAQDANKVPASVSTDGGPDHGRLAPPEREEDQRHHAGGGEQQLLDQRLRPCRWR